MKIVSLFCCRRCFCLFSLLALFLGLRFCSRCHATFYFTFYVFHASARLPRTDVCLLFIFAPNPRSFIYNNGTRLLVSCCFSRFIFLFLRFSPFCIRLYLLTVDIAWCVCVCESCFTRSCTLFVNPFVLLLFFLPFFVLFWLLPLFHEY